MNGYKLGLSSAAVQNALHISDTSYRRAVKELLKKGYFIQKTTSKYDFYTSPQPTSYVAKAKKKKVIGGVMDEKCRIIFCINLPSNNGGLFAYQHTEMHRHAASPSSTNRETRNYYLFSSYSFSLFTQEVAGDALYESFIFLHLSKKSESTSLSDFFHCLFQSSSEFQHN